MELLAAGTPDKQERFPYKEEMAGYDYENDEKTYYLKCPDIVDSTP